MRTKSYDLKLNDDTALPPFDGIIYEVKPPEAGTEHLFFFFVTDCDTLPREENRTLWGHVSHHVIGWCELWSKIEEGKVVVSHDYKDPFYLEREAVDCFIDKTHPEDCDDWVGSDKWKEWKEWKRKDGSIGSVIGMAECKLTHDGKGGWSEHYDVLYLEQSGVVIPPDFEDEETEEVVLTSFTLSEDECKEILRICAQSPRENPELVKAFQTLKWWQEANKKW